jgi:hypothetical protein
MLYIYFTMSLKLSSLVALLLEVNAVEIMRLVAILD